MRRRLLLVPLVVLGACASNEGMSVEEMRSASVRPERQIPSELVEIRENMTEMRDDTLTRLDQVMGAAPPEASSWYTPVFDALDFAISIGHLLY